MRFYGGGVEPFEKCDVEIVKINEETVRIKGSGIAIIDGYATPYITANFEFDEVIPFVDNFNDC